MTRNYRIFTGYVYILICWNSVCFILYLINIHSLNTVTCRATWFNKWVFVFFPESYIWLGTWSQSASQIQRNECRSTQFEERIFLLSCGVADADKTSRCQKKRTWNWYERYCQWSCSGFPAKVIILSNNNSLY